VFGVLCHFKGFGSKFLGSRFSTQERAVLAFTPAKDHEEEKGFLEAWAAAAAAAAAVAA
jgi:hypothetical protein